MADMFKSARLTYRAIEESDDPFLVSLHQDPEAYQNTVPWLPVPQGKKSAPEHREHFEKCMLAAMICIRDAEEDTPIGLVTMKDTNIPPNGKHIRHAKIGINIKREYQGRGFGKEAVKWLLDWGFRRAGLHKISLTVYEYNSSAIKLYEKLGFVREARLRDEVWHDGRFWEDYIYSMLEDEWRQLEKTS
ncbi:putative N-acetyltransferase p20 [Pseudocercospora fuligena]|uniref:Putative N-acetyltransferase p20 n=1 Tax=Pseudocercospora fuligena TaxID=685502 RepID=A0A8H6VDF2_9PEZI|nr:putative N-acetyltransferase p20 [Pseudocercospora fuligena]